MVNRFLRTAPTRTLLATIAGAVVAIAGGTAIALAAQGGGPVPKAEPLAAAVRGAVTAHSVKGISADVSFTNRLIDSSELQGSDPLLQGGSGHVWVSDTGQIRLELYGGNGDPMIVLGGRSWWISDPTLQTVYHGNLPAQAPDKTQSHHQAVPSMGQIQADINRLAQHLDISGAAPTDVGGRPTYTVSVSPRQTPGMLGKLQLAWDAIEGVPLRFAVYARGDSTPVLELSATNITYGAVDSSVFQIKPPAAYHVVDIATPIAAAPGERPTKHTGRTKHHQISGIKTVASHLSFKLDAPASLGGLSRQSVALLGQKSHASALVTYGQGFGGIAVIEEAATTSSARQLQLSQGSGDHQNGVTLPTFSVHGATAQELDTALGTFVRFTSGGVTYTVVGSVPPHVARAAAGAL